MDDKMVTIPYTLYLKMIRAHRRSLQYFDMTMKLGSEENQLYFQISDAVVAAEEWENKNLKNGEEPKA